MQVLFLTTGECEARALESALRRLFPSVNMQSRRVDGFTSRSLPERPLLEPGTNIMNLARELVAAVEPGERRRPADLVMLIEDLELVNMAWPDRVVRHLKAAVDAHLRTHPWRSESSRQKALERTRERCSFHLLCPMVEAYFFGEPGAVGSPGALQRAGARRTPEFAPELCDVETFETVDEAYLAIPDRSTYMDGRPIEWTTSDRARHPKSYLRFLCDPELSGEKRWRYRETQGGCRALAELDWSAVLAPSCHARFLRSMLSDLAEGLGASLPFLSGDVHDLTCRKAGVPGQVLRNL